MTPATTVPCTTEAVAPITVILNVRWIASGFARVDRAVQTIAAGASGFPALRGKIVIEFKQELVKTGIVEQVLIQDNCLLHFGR